ncbi:hypothetical protein D3C75_613750 [compost metagenome]
MNARTASRPSTISSAESRSRSSTKITRRSQGFTFRNIPEGSLNAFNCSRSISSYCSALALGRETLVIDRKLSTFEGFRFLSR